VIPIEFEVHETDKKQKKERTPSYVEEQFQANIHEAN